MSGEPESRYWDQPGRDQLTADDIAAARSLWGLPGGGFERHGTPGDDHLAGSAGDDILAGGEGDDTLVGGSGSIDHTDFIF